ncbi:hypothetical protein [Paenibacillus sp. FSL P2-0136]|uniref:hypothetical protein n=1 Tax=Paenibacillus sp. FSL P2-0136 TaxID=2975317 RepID=UPI0030DC5AAD
MTENHPIYLVSEHAVNGVFLKQFDLEIKITCPLCGNDINGYVKCANNIIQQIHFHSCKCNNTIEMCQLIELLFRDLSIDDLYDEAFVTRFTKQLSSYSLEIYDTGLSLPDKILYAFYNRYFA